MTQPLQNPFGPTSPRPCVWCSCRSNQRKYMITQQPFCVRVSTCSAFVSTLRR